MWLPREADEIKPKLIPAAENIWYALATIAGEAEGIEDETVYQHNCHFWNGYMRTHMGEEEYNQLNDPQGNQIELPHLNKQENKYIRSMLSLRAFKTPPLSKHTINFKNVEFPKVNFSECG